MRINTTLVIRNYLTFIYYYNKWNIQRFYVRIIYSLNNFILDSHINGQKSFDVAFYAR